MNKNVTDNKDGDVWDNKDRKPQAYQNDESGGKNGCKGFLGGRGGWQIFKNEKHTDSCTKINPHESVKTYIGWSWLISLVTCSRVLRTDLAGWIICSKSSGLWLLLGGLKCRHYHLGMYMWILCTVHQCCSNWLTFVPWIIGYLVF